MKSMKTDCSALVKRSKINHFDSYYLRRNAGCLMAESGVRIEDIAQYLGHTNPNITRSTYAQFSQDYLRNAAGSLEFKGPSLVQRTRAQTPKG